MLSFNSQKNNVFFFCADRDRPSFLENPNSIVESRVLKRQLPKLWAFGVVPYNLGWTASPTRNVANWRDGDVVCYVCHCGGNGDIVRCLRVSILLLFYLSFSFDIRSVFPNTNRVRNFIEHQISFREIPERFYDLPNISRYYLIILFL